MCRSTKKDNQKASCHKCGGFHGQPSIQLSYVGHAQVTNRLLEADPAWTWKPMATTPAGLPAFVLDGGGKPVGLWILLTVCGVTRPGFGSVEGGAFDAEKQLIGDALRNAAMRFGVALDLWSKSELEESGDTEVEPHPPEPRPAPQPQPRKTTADSRGPTSNRGAPPAWLDEHLPGKKFPGKTWRFLVMGDETNSFSKPTIGGERWNWLEFVNSQNMEWDNGKTLECLSFIETSKWGGMTFTPSSQRKAQGGPTKAT